MPIETPSTAPKKKTSTQPGYLLFTLEIIAVLAVAFFFTWPQYKSLQAEKTQLATDQGALAQAQEQAAAYQSSVKALSASNLSSVDEAIPAKDNTTDLYAYLETLVNASSLTLTSIQVTDSSAATATAGAGTAGAATTAAAPAATSTFGTSNPSSPTTPGAPAIPAGVGTVKIHLVLTGTQAQLAQLLGSFQNSLRLIDVQGVSVDVDSSGIENFTVDALTYYSTQQ